MKKRLTWKPEEHDAKTNYKFIMELFHEGFDEFSTMLFEYCQERSLV